MPAARSTLATNSLSGVGVGVPVVAVLAGKLSFQVGVSGAKVRAPLPARHWRGGQEGHPQQILDQPVRRYGAPQVEEAIGQ
jgi:hypothetical protein